MINRNIISPCLHILNEAQIEIYPIFKFITSLDFVLYGGTAISLLFGHRQSVDFDFFSSMILDDNLKLIILNNNNIFKTSKIIQNSFNTLTIKTYNDVKISFFGGLTFGRVGEPQMTDDKILRLASPFDLFGTKLKVIMERAEYRDYKDIIELIKNHNELSLGLASAQSLYQKMYYPIDGIKALTFFSEGNLNELTVDEKSFLIKSVQNIDLFHLPEAPIISYNLSF
ncbi:MAG: nucleotidyl transferase AbiEii/AbiGii toxin family protein [Deltaproteobacteria bacterium]|jgi:hypothetical protein|nr:nucleotidyl transferase AbiEii/AbiGii toxin family protein [Deltaproteobacteria bacterium]